MNPISATACTIAAMAIGSTAALAQPSGSASPNVDVGKYEYEAHCAICHGSNGKGMDREPYWSLLSKDIPDLTGLAKRNAGVFPFARVYEVIDGRQAMQAHGPRDMPIWGREFTAESLNLSPYYDQEAFARAKILALTEYVYRLGTK